MNQFPLPTALAADLGRVEALVAERARSRAAVLSAAGAGLLQPGAERIRAGLVLVSALAGEYRAERVLHAAAAVELIHAATQTHGDLVDEAERRRGAPRVGAWSQGVALMVGDYLFALAAGEMALMPDPRVISYYAQAVMRITESALAEPPPLRPLDKARPRHLDRLGGAASLVAAACQAGGACAGAAPEQIEALARFGHELGMALALADEIRAHGDADGAPLQSGAVTLPLIYAANAGDGARLAAALDGAESERAWAVAEVARHGLAPARAEVARYAEAARATLEAMPPGPARDALGQAADFVVSRSAQVTEG